MSPHLRAEALPQGTLPELTPPLPPNAFQCQQSIIYFKGYSDNMTTDRIIEPRPIKKILVANRYSAKDTTPPKEDIY